MRADLFGLLAQMEERRADNTADVVGCIMTGRKPRSNAEVLGSIPR